MADPGPVVWHDKTTPDPENHPRGRAERDPGRVSGALILRGTRVPVSALFENLEDGAQISEFLEWFPGVTLQQARTVLEHAARPLEVA